jgi:hypothetical protein
MKEQPGTQQFYRNLKILALRNILLVAFLIGFILQSCVMPSDKWELVSDYEDAWVIDVSGTNGVAVFSQASPNNSILTYLDFIQTEPFKLNNTLPQTGG